MALVEGHKRIVGHWPEEKEEHRLSRMDCIGSRWVVLELVGSMWAVVLELAAAVPCAGSCNACPYISSLVDKLIDG